MWTWVRIAVADPSRGKRRTPKRDSKPRTTLKDLEDYNALREEFPDVEPVAFDEYGLPDQVRHLEALRALKAEKDAREAPSLPAPEHTPSTGRGHQIELWPDPLPKREPQSSGINYEPASSLDRRAPGRALIDQMMQTDTPLPQRTPGALGPPGPPRQTYDEWVRGLREKGIELGPDGKRPGAITDLPQRKPQPPRGRDVWGDLIRPERAQTGVMRAASTDQSKLDSTNQWIAACLDKYAYHDNRDELGRFAPSDYRKPTMKRDKPGAYHHALREFGGDSAKALAWDRLRREHPDEPIGPDESYHDHFMRLKRKYQGGEPPKRQHNKIRPHVEKRKKSHVAMLDFINKVLAGAS